MLGLCDTEDGAQDSMPAEHPRVQVWGLWFGLVFLGDTKKEALATPLNILS